MAAQAIRSKFDGIKVGDAFGRLTVINILGPIKGHRSASFRCECGKEIVTRFSSVVTGSVKSCGCFHDEMARRRFVRHGGSIGGRESRTYTSWQSMIQRCFNEKNDAYHRYGGRGIMVCERWRDFANFLADMGERPSRMTIERNDNNGNYEPGNCRWATKLEQANNTSWNRLITYQGRTQTLQQWSRETGISNILLRYRIVAAGWPVEKAFTAPIHGQGTHCQRGHELTPDNLRISHGKWRSCRTCANEATRKRKKAKKAACTH